jgi:hypothetical protein
VRLVQNLLRCCWRWILLEQRSKAVSFCCNLGSLGSFLLPHHLSEKTDQNPTRLPMSYVGAERKQVPSVRADADADQVEAVGEGIRNVGCVVWRTVRSEKTE